MVLELILTLIITIGVLFLSYYVTKSIGKGSMLKRKIKYIKVIDQIAIGQDRFVSIVQVGNRYFLLGNTSDNINLINEIGEEDILLLSSESEENSTDFKKLMDSISKVIKPGDKK